MMHWQYYVYYMNFMIPHIYIVNFNNIYICIVRFNRDPIVGKEVWSLNANPNDKKYDYQ